MLDMEEELIIGYFDDIFDVVFFYIILCVLERFVKIDVFFWVVDEILEISVYVIMVSGDFENVFFVKEVIIEIVMVVIFIVVESMVMVGIEMVVMVFG